MAIEYKLSYTASEIDEKLGKIDSKANISDIPTKVSELANDKNYLTTIPSEYVTETELNAKKYLTSYTETDPTVPEWAKQANKPTYTADEVGAVSKNQGSANVGKILVVGTDGNLTLTNMPEGGASGDVIGVLDDSNNILLSGNLENGKYTLKFENTDGTYTDIGILEVGKIVPEPTNLFVIGGDGYLLNGRCSSKGAHRVDNTGCVLSNYIDVKNGDTVYVKNAPVRSTTYSGIKLTDGSCIGLMINTSEYITNYLESNGITQFTINKADADYIRITMDVNYGTSITNDDVINTGIIITVNEPLS